METKPIRIEAKIDAKVLFSFMLRHTYTSFSGILTILIGIGAFVLFYQSLSGNDDTQKLILLIIALLFTVGNPYLLYKKAKDQAKRNPLYKEKLVYTLDDVGVHLNVEDKEETLEWPRIKKWKKTGKVCILYTSKIHAILLPYKDMGEQRKAVEALIQSKVK